jgi:predicted nucleic acid-binding protein
VPEAFDNAARQVAIYQDVFLTPATTNAVLGDAAALARDHRLRLWDCIICAAALQSGAGIFLTEDMQDGRLIGRMRLLNPFLVSNTGAINVALRR